MPKTIKIVHDGIKCPAPKRRGGQMSACCIRDPKWKDNSTTVKFLPRQQGDLTISYDVIQAYSNNYWAQITMDNHHPLSRLDNWNLTWEWMRGEFIYSTKGPTRSSRTPPTACTARPATTTATSTSPRSPTARNVPSRGPPRNGEKDSELGNIPYCCKNGTLLPPTMDPSRSKAVFQIQVFKLPPDLNRTALYPPQKWKITGVLNPDYKCGAPIRVSPTEFPDQSGLMAESLALASWQVVCNMTKDKPKHARCCVSFSAYYNDSVVPCSTCACGCPHSATCDADAPAMLLPPEALLVPFTNRSAKAKAWARIKHLPFAQPCPCGDNCGISVNWHLYSDYKNGWTARITLFNWEDYTFRDWFAAIQMKKSISAGYENVYSFNGTKMNDTYWPGLGNLVFMQGLPGLNYLMPEVDGKNPWDPRIPGKQQSVISFKKAKTPGIDIRAGDGFPAKVFFNGEECSLPDAIPASDGYISFPVSQVGLLSWALVVAVVHVLFNDLNEWS
ncbi:hypothetical protein HPP92_009892 [Vanilla planifolia]|uniref:COBRA C-terminal domain-containing protein n=1 Tax=Vanilla planifolia TaxID=51239 RepID=A0A835V1Y8_VANPL|nr:hypothetical protein HPP92_009892 [Vanilla planifolia]